jgi:cell division protein FtsW (lipid II flippase)
MQDILGWIGTGLILYSFTLNDIKKLRIVNMFGSMAWITYGIQTGIMPTIFVNVCVLIIHAHWLIRNKSIKTTKGKLIKRGYEWPE